MFLRTLFKVVFVNTNRQRTHSFCITNTVTQWRFESSNVIGLLVSVSEKSPRAHTCALLHFTPQAVLSPLALLVHSNVVVFSLYLSENVCFLQWSLCSTVLVFAVWYVMFEFAQKSPLSHSGLSNQEHISLRRPLPCHQWLGKKIPAHPHSPPPLYPKYGYQPCPSPNPLNLLASTSDWLTITSCLFTPLFHYWPCIWRSFPLAG